MIINGDTDVESNETFSIGLSNAMGGATLGGDATVTINNDDAAASTLQVDSITKMGNGTTGFAIRFDQPLLPDDVNLFEQGNGFQPLGISQAGDVQVEIVSGPNAGQNFGIDSNDELAFLAYWSQDRQTLNLVLETAFADGRPGIAPYTPAVLPEGEYQITLESSSTNNSFRTPGGDRLDGNFSGTVDPADNFITGAPGNPIGLENITVAAPTGDEFIVSLPTFVRGPGQVVELPFESSVGAGDQGLGIPLYLSDPVVNSTGNRIAGVQFDLGYNTALLDITTFVPNSGQLAGVPSADITTANFNSGLLVVTAATGFGAGAGLDNTPVLLGWFTAGTQGSPVAPSVPDTTANRDAYGEKFALDIQNLVVSDINTSNISNLAFDDDGIHINGYMMDFNADRVHDVFDQLRSDQFSVSISNILPAGGWQNIHPEVITDYNRDGIYDLFDQSVTGQLASAITTVVPARASGITPLSNGIQGPDPILFLDSGAATGGLKAGETITIPVTVRNTDSKPINVAGVQFPFGYTTSVFELPDTSSDLVVGLNGFGGFESPNVVSGNVGASFTNPTGVNLNPDESVVVANINLKVRDDATEGDLFLVNLFEANPDTGILSLVISNTLEVLPLIPAPTDGDDTAAIIPGVPDAGGIDFGGVVDQDPFIDLEVELSSSASLVNLGERVSFTVTVRNAGVDTATNVFIRDVVPAFTVISRTVSQGSLGKGKGAIPWNLGELGPNESATLTIVGTANRVGTLFNYAQVLSVNEDTDPDSTPGNNSGLGRNGDPRAEDDDATVKITVVDDRLDRGERDFLRGNLGLDLFFGQIADKERGKLLDRFFWLNLEEVTEIDPLQ